MARIYMVRHGRAAAGFSEDADPGLDEIGHQQAIEAAQKLNSVLPVAIISSPLAGPGNCNAPRGHLWHCCCNRQSGG